MQAVLSNFHNEINALRNLILLFDKEILVAKENIEGVSVIEEYIKSYKELAIAKRRYNYNSLIISLYGYLEKFIEEVLSSYIEKINGYIPNYEDLPDIIKKNHFRLSLHLLDKVDSNKYNGDLKKEHIVKNLHFCLSSNSEYILNKDAFSKHSANFRREIIDECFNKIGINSISNKILGEEAFKKYVDSTSENLFYYLDDLAERRNDVAHGVPSEILGNEIIHEYINFIECYSTSLIQIVNEELLRVEVHFRGIDLGSITDIYRNGTIICIYTNNIPLSKGDYIIAYSKEKITKVQILNIQLNGTDLDFTDENMNCEVGLLLSNKISKKTENIKWILPD